VTATDPTAMVITIVLPSGDQQQLSVANDAVITRDGTRHRSGRCSRATTCGLASIQLPQGLEGRRKVESSKAPQVEVERQLEVDDATEEVSR